MDYAPRSIFESKRITMKRLSLLLSLCASISSYAQPQTKVMEKLNRNEPQLVCKLTTPELQERKKTILGDLKKIMIQKKETESGFEYRFAATDDTLDLLTAFIKTERLCCDFFSYRLSLNNSVLLLELTGPEGVKEFIKTELDL